MSKQKYVWKSTAALVIACSVVLSGCGSQGSNNGNEEVVVTPSPTPPVTESPSGPTEEDVSDEGSSVTEPETIAELIQQIEDEVGFASMMDVTGDMIKDIYYMDSDEYVEEGVFHQAMMNVKANDLVIIKLKDATNFDKVKDALTKRAEDVIKQFSTYLPDQHENAKNYQIVQEGEYVLYSISHNQEKILSLFQDYITK